MTVEQFNAFCGSLPHSTYVVQWGGAHVWKIGGKVFAIGGWNGKTNTAQAIAVSFKVSPLGFEVMKDQKGVRPAPYLASRGMKWLQRTSAEAMSDAALKDHLRESYRLVSLGLTKAAQRDLGLNQAPAPAARKSKSRNSKPAQSKSTP